MAFRLAHGPRVENEGLGSDHATVVVNETFVSIQGEAAQTGRPTVFIRLTGCPLRCRWCDTQYAFTRGTKWEVSDIVARVADYGVNPVCITGGEPLVQIGARRLAELLCSAGHEVSIETSGAVPIDGLDSRIRVVMDLKPPGSGESHRNRLDNLTLLSTRDQVKFVLSDRADYEWSKSMLERYHDRFKAEVLFSPVFGELEPRALAEWILADRLPVRLQIQLHKLLWGDVAGR